VDSSVSVPELPDGLEWVNVDQPVRLRALRGRVVILHFWSYSNTHSQHNIPDLRHLEVKYHDGLCVVSIHCPRFPAEREPANVLKAVNRAFIRHPVASDPHFQAWDVWGVNAWPTLVVLDTSGRPVRTFVGEGHRSMLDPLVNDLLEDAAARDARVYESVQPAARPESKLPLRFPGRVLATESLLYVADSGHNRIIEVTHDGRVLRQFGSGNPGFWDGKGGDAAFNDPQGMAIVKDLLYVADRGNHAIRRVRLHNGEVDTLAGTGQQGLEAVVDSPNLRGTGLNAPCDLTAAAEQLFIAMSGSNQVWAIDLARRIIGRVVGTGAHDLRDGGIDIAAFARPSGVAAGVQALYVADADASAIRSVRLLDAHVRTLAGAGLYESGDTDGVPNRVRLQGPTAIALDPGGSILWIADTLNGKIKALSLRGGGVRTLAVPYRLHEPGGIASAAQSLWVANTNAHEVLRIDTGTGQIRRVPIGD
jgi:hypothetical protein